MKYSSLLRMGLLATLLVGSQVIANHGPGTSGGGSATISGETMKQGKWELSLREDFTQFQNINREGAERRALTAGEFDAIRKSYITNAAIAYGWTDSLQLGAQIGYYSGDNFIDAESEDGITAESSTANPSGLTDLNLTAKYRLMQGAPGNLSVIGGVIAPTGKNDVELSDGNRLEPSSQPGSGTWSWQLGVAYSRFLTSHITMDASALYTTRVRHDGFKIGDRWDLGTAVAYRLNESVQEFPNYSIFAEVNAIHLGHDDDAGDTNPNSGGWTAYITPGARVRFDEHLSLTVAPSFPFLQELDGQQIETKFKLAITVSYAF